MSEESSMLEVLVKKRQTSRKNYWGVTTRILSNFTRSIVAFSWAHSYESLKKWIEIMNSF